MLAQPVLACPHYLTRLRDDTFALNHIRIVGSEGLRIVGSDGSLIGLYILKVLLFTIKNIRKLLVTLTVILQDIQYLFLCRPMDLWMGKWTL